MSDKKISVCNSLLPFSNLNLFGADQKKLKFHRRYDGKSLVTLKKCKYIQYRMYSLQVPDGLGVRIPGFHPGGPGSIPGLGAFFCIHRLHFYLNLRKV